MTDKCNVDKESFEDSELTGKEKNLGHFGDSVAALASGAAFASGLVFFVEPITSRLFPPESFGQASVFLSGANIVGIVACLCYEMALVLPKKDEDAGNIFALSALILASMTILTAIVILGFGRDFLGFLNMEAVVSFTWLFPVAVFVIGLELLLRSWYTRYKEEKNLLYIDGPVPGANGFGGVRGGGRRPHQWIQPDPLQDSWTNWTLCVSLVEFLEA